MSPSITPTSAFRRRAVCRRLHSFSLLELLIVIGVVAILFGLAVPVIALLLRANQMDQSVTTLNGVLEQAREAAISQNTFVWVAFTTNSPTKPANGVMVATIQSQDGTETGINSSSVPVWTTTVTLPAANLQQLYKPQNLPGVSVILATSFTSATSNLFVAAGAPTTGGMTNMTGSLQWTVPAVKNADGFSGSLLVNAIEFTPNGEAHMASGAAGSWYSYITFGLQPAIGSTNNVALFCVSRLTGKTTVYRPK